MNLQESVTMTKKWTIRRFADDAAFAAGVPTPVVDANGQELPAVSEVTGNLLLNEGIGELLDLLCGLGSPAAFSNANAYLGVGDSTTSEAASQTALQAASNKAFVAMSSGYPSRTDQTVTWRAAFGSGAANFDWREFTVTNGSSDSAKNLNRKVSSQGTKASGQTWTLDLSITVS